MNCPICKAKMIADMDISGGCVGHAVGEYCYCPSKDVSVEFSCPNNVRETYEYDKVIRKGRFVKNKDYCKQGRIQINELGDKDSITRWLTEHYGGPEK